MKIKWLLTAGFEIITKNNKILIDPYISRPRNAVPQLETKISEIKDANMIFLSHGHFDHAFDLPDILKFTDMKLYCSKQVEEMLINDHRVDKKNIQAVKGGDVLNFEPDFKVTVIKSKHIRFNNTLVLKKIFSGQLLKIKKMTGMPAKSILKWKKGDVLGYLFEFSNGKKLLHFGSGGYLEEEIEKLPKDIDYFMGPVAGRSDVDKVLAKLTGLIKPKVVIPQHYDDFFPPVSWMSYGNFDEEMKLVDPEIEIMKIDPEVYIEI